ncbi:MAG: cytochrome b5 domain-containing protein [Anaerolineales bacterium]
MQIFTLEELSLYNGKNGKPAYIAYEGKVYDVSNSWYWQNGMHQALHAAGQDLTHSLNHAPHGADFLQRVPLIGVLEQ